MKFVQTHLSGLYKVEPTLHGDSRGKFFEAYRRSQFEDIGASVLFVQDNVSISAQNVLRGLHLQNPNGQDKLVSVMSGEVFDVAVDLRVGSPTFSEWYGALLSSENFHQLFIPKGFAHAFFVLSESATFSYKCSDYYSPSNELTVRWDDPDIDIAWPEEDAIISNKDQDGLYLRDIPEDRLPRWNV